LRVFALSFWFGINTFSVLDPFLKPKGPPCLPDGILQALVRLPSSAALDLPFPFFLVKVDMGSNAEVFPPTENFFSRPQAPVPIQPQIFNPVSERNEEQLFGSHLSLF